ncbi:uncharacterized protein NFIA_036160 [Aspergillus fischeri NRRL 181]|uniref:Uncharacterized protein n=1 Tax=Neosartorya fischeri (strain ATCC 1020 / DSM 3700 / CBS 544.65 / FGSC A1164 / JCM 1740 / NRRL 181 / WB 181) TaxID=331117 RepID=A1CZ74_NEOFI|nr:uncharacterized protein NFIA_036160 [Aspergillus fischeri NRRL 181]EAW24044.1 hypothetical protein NFIA_036160 [Aspergillus fischeri NRRL 181]KAG2017073.1 hypothetical protein GB937_005670 [Aspergillus fischeri]
MAQGKLNEEIQVDITRLFGDDDNDRANPLHDIALRLKRAIITVSNKALQDGAAEVNNAVQGVTQDAAQTAMQEQEAIQEAAQELGQEAAQEVTQQAGGGLALQTVEQLVQYVVVRNSVEKIWMAAMEPAAYGGEGPDAVVMFLKVMLDIKTARHTASQYMKDETHSEVKAVEDAKDTARKPFPGSAEDAASKARVAAAEITEAVRRLKTVWQMQLKLQMTSKLNDMVAVYIPGKRPEWEIEDVEGMDPSLAAIIGVLLAATLYQSSVKGKPPESFGEGDSAVGTSEKASLI